MIRTIQKLLDSKVLEDNFIGLELLAKQPLNIIGLFCPEVDIDDWGEARNMVCSGGTKADIGENVGYYINTIYSTYLLMCGEGIWHCSNVEEKVIQERYYKKIN